MKKRLTSEETQRLEQLLCQAAEWEPDTAMPGDFVRRALQPRAKNAIKFGPPVWAASGALAAAAVSLLAVFHPLTLHTDTAPTHPMSVPTTRLAFAASATLASTTSIQNNTRPAVKEPLRTVASTGNVAPEKAVPAFHAATLSTRQVVRDDSVRRASHRLRRRLRLPAHPSVTPPERTLPEAIPSNHAPLVAEAKQVLLVPVVIADQVPTEDGQGTEEVYTPALVAVSLNTTGSGTTEATPSPRPVSVSAEPSPEQTPTLP